MSLRIWFLTSLNSTNNTSQLSHGWRMITLRRRVNTYKALRTGRSWMECMNAFFAHVVQRVAQVIGGTKTNTLVRLHLCRPTDGWQTLGYVLFIGYFFQWLGYLYYCIGFLQATTWWEASKWLEHVPLPHHFQLFTNMPEGTQPCASHCENQAWACNGVSRYLSSRTLRSRIGYRCLWWLYVWHTKHKRTSGDCRSWRDRFGFWGVGTMSTRPRMGSFGVVPVYSFCCRFLLYTHNICRLKPNGICFFGPPDAYQLAISVSITIDYDWV